ncbi:hypothetical protein [Sorangium sp. So ce861]|uniref:hypothetical protein n=1 Tax=Sorangium sp. So ce861 TaxID=3133323 RepID=UPI003F5FB672
MVSPCSAADRGRKFSVEVESVAFRIKSEAMISARFEERRGAQLVGIKFLIFGAGLEDASVDIEEGIAREDVVADGAVSEPVDQEPVVGIKLARVDTFALSPNDFDLPNFAKPIARFVVRARAEVGLDVKEFALADKAIVFGIKGRAHHFASY